MRLRHRSQELDFEEMNRSLNQDSRSNDSEITDFTFEIKSELYDEASQEPIDRVASPQVCILFKHPFSVLLEFGRSNVVIAILLPFWGSLDLCKIKQSILNRAQN